MTWFADLFGFEERDVDGVADHIDIDGPWLTSRSNGRRFHHGHLTVLTLGELLARLEPLRNPGARRLTLREHVGDVTDLHLNPANAGAIFQVASQLNALEMVSPSVTPEAGITGYVHDPTQGPACAIACAAGTLYRNHLVPIDGEVGQSTSTQLDTLAAYQSAVDVDLTIVNGYCLPTADQLAAITGAASGIDHVGVAVHADTEVTLPGADHRVTQVYASAMPIAYHDQPLDAWEPLARDVLHGAYRATLAVAGLTAADGGNPTVFLTLLGGGVFGNPTSWILDAIADTCHDLADLPLDVVIVSHAGPNPELAPLVD